MSSLNFSLSSIINRQACASIASVHHSLPRHNPVGPGALRSIESCRKVRGRSFHSTVRRRRIPSINERLVTFLSGKSRKGASLGGTQPIVVHMVRSEKSGGVRSGLGLATWLLVATTLESVLTYQSHVVATQPELAAKYKDKIEASRIKKIQDETADALANGLANSWLGWNTVSLIALGLLRKRSPVMLGIGVPFAVLSSQVALVEKIQKMEKSALDKEVNGESVVGKITDLAGRVAVGIFTGIWVFGKKE